MQERIEQQRRQRADKAALSRLLPGAGVERLTGDEVDALLAYIDRIITGTQAQAWRAGWNDGWSQAVDFTAPRSIKNNTEH